MADFKWDDYATEAPDKAGGFNWDDHPIETPNISMLESAHRGAAQGVSLGFGDELSGGAGYLGGKLGLVPDKGYDYYRDYARNADKESQAANPGTYGASELAGTVGTAFIPGLNAAGAGLAGTAGRAAIQGGLAGAGSTEESLLSGAGAADIAKGVGLGAAGGAAGYGLGKGISQGIDLAKNIGMASSKVPFGSLAEETASKSPGLLNKILPKISSIFSGVDEDAARRQIARPNQTAAAQADSFGYKLGNQALGETEVLKKNLGSEVGEAGNEFLAQHGDTPMPNQLSDKIDSFLKENAPSGMGFSAVSPSERGYLHEMSRALKGIPTKDEIENSLRGIMEKGNYETDPDTLVSLLQSPKTLNRAVQNGTVNGDEVYDILQKLQPFAQKPVTGEDLYKFRGYLDHVEKLAGKYDQDGTGPFTNFLKSLRGDADKIADQASPRLDTANQAYGQFKQDTNLLRGSTNEGQAESMINNLYGANKGARQEAAGRLFSPETMESAKDIAANKAFENANRPGGNNYFRRTALGILTGGLSEVATNPSINKVALRTAGRVSTALPELVKSQPQIFGKFAPVLQAAAQRGTQGLAATHFILQQTQPEYQDLMRKMNESGDSQ